MIKIENLTKTYNYKKSNAFTALKDVSLKIDDGEMVAIIGKSGYTIDETNVHKLSDKQLAKIRNEKVGIVMQDFALVEEYTVLENVRIPLYFSHSKKSDKPKALALAALKRVGISELANKPVNKLSGGQKQRVAIARAIVNNPSFILADEPTGALDTKTSAEIMELFKNLNDDGKTIIIITHDMGIADSCQRKIEISDGRLI